MEIDNQLEAAIKWAEERLRNGSEPPFIYYRLMQLREAAQELLPHAKQQTEGSHELVEHPESVQQQAAQEHLPKIVQLHPSAPDLPTHR